MSEKLTANKCKCGNWLVPDLLNCTAMGDEYPTYVVVWSCLLDMTNAHKKLIEQEKNV